MTPFNSDRFFNDEFFAESVEFGGKSYSAILSEVDEVTTQGDFTSRPGWWQEISFRKSDLSMLPKHLDTITARGAEFRVQGTPVVSGDIVKVKCITDRRFVK